jgi:PadR family transcriptional regulator, regulatory protein PadR
VGLAVAAALRGLVQVLEALQVENARAKLLRLGAAAGRGAGRPRRAPGGGAERAREVVLLPMRAEVLKGHLDGLLLATLATGPRHGYAIKEALRVGSGGRFDLPTGTVYPALHRLERAGLIRGSWSTVNGRRRRSYQLTASGRRALGDERSSWQEFSAAVTALLGNPPRLAPT